MAETVVVTGASGFIATELVKQLLEKGYNVRGTVRDVSNTEKVQHLKALGDALPGQLSLHAADLLKEGSFDEVVQGARYVFHTASPFLRSGFTDPQKELVDPAVNGTRNVLNAAGKSKSVQRVVVTSSFAAIVRPKAGPSNGKVFTEEDWNDESSLDNGPYRLSKTEAEKAAWELSKQHGFELVTINPTFVLGPITSARTDAESIKAAKGFIEGQGDTLLATVCDVRDVARAHVLAVETPAAKGNRYLVSQPNNVPAKSLAEALAAHFPQFQFPQVEESDSKPVLDSSKVQKELGLQLTDPRVSIVDMARTLIQQGIAKPVPAKKQ
ncbi:hypothetical protein WJX72_003318 [[Myrmecia] bisecta]|uniref:Flavanone 4-reductase n=1 Tax=[Myrmecia] bisecta TaxID=41462 RepID=A0AAW1PPT6_9CHLO